MVNLPPELVLAKTLAIGSIYKLVAPELINTSIPHYFIVVSILDDDNYMVLSTTKGDKKEKLFNSRGFDLEGLVFIRPDAKNNLPTNSFIDCNYNFEITKQELIEKLRLGKLKFIGNISYNHYDQIRTGIINSHINDLPSELLIHPEDDL